MSKIYSLYGNDERKIDNLKRKIRGYEKMKNDLLIVNRTLKKENKQLKEQIVKKENIINKAKEKLNHIQLTYGYMLDDVIFLLNNIN